MLSQAEIDALLGAVAEGTLPTEDQPPSLSADGRIVKTYDFRRPAKFSNEQLRTLQAIHENVGRVAAARLSSFLRGTVVIQLAGTDQLVFDDYLSQLALPTQLVVMTSTGLGGPFMADLDLGFAFAAVDRLLGGPGRIPIDRTEPTPIEADLIARVVSHLPHALNEGWAHLQALDVSITETALTPILLRLAAPTEVVAVLTYEVRFAGQTAPMTVCYPYATLEPLLPRLAATMWYAQRRQAAGGNSSVREVLENEVRSVEVPIAAAFRAVEIPVEALAELQPGDVIRFDERFDEPVLLTVADQAQAWAMPGRVGDRIALRLVTQLAPTEA
jgi:flagellar motor switch protein FliM